MVWFHANADRVAAPYSLSQDEAFGRAGWGWQYPADVDGWIAAQTPG